MKERGRRVLVVDDEPAIREVLVALLRDHRVVAVDGREARARLTEPWDVVLCDLMMPGISGMDLFAEARAQGQGMERRFVFLTGGAVSELERDFLKNCGQPTLHKPFRGATLRALVEQVGGGSDPAS